MLAVSPHWGRNVPGVVWALAIGSRAASAPPLKLANSPASVRALGGNPRDVAMASSVAGTGWGICSFPGGGWFTVALARPPKSDVPAARQRTMRFIVEPGDIL